VAGDDMGISLSNINNIGLEQFITTSSSGEPNWSYIPTKGKSTKTQAEFVSEIKELAQKASRAQANDLAGINYLYN
jgi:hypothetical protein